MYRKNWVIYIILLVISITLCGCSENNKKFQHADKAQDKLISMESYACLVQVTHLNDDKKNTYEAKQIYHTDGKYRMEIIKPENMKGLTTVFNGEKILQYNPNVPQSQIVELIPSGFRNQMFLGTFVQNYLQSEKVTLEVQNIEKTHATVLEAIIPGGSTYMASQKLWINENNYMPIRMAIYDKDNKEIVTIEFQEFTYNPEIKKGAFSLE